MDWGWGSFLTTTDLGTVSGFFLVKPQHNRRIFLAQGNQTSVFWVSSVFSHLCLLKTSRQAEFPISIFSSNLTIDGPRVGPVGVPLDLVHPDPWRTFFAPFWSQWLNPQKNSCGPSICVRKTMFLALSQPKIRIHKSPVSGSVDFRSV